MKTFGAIQIGNKSFELEASRELTAEENQAATKAIGSWLRSGNDSLYDGPSHVVQVWVSPVAFSVTDGWGWDWSGNVVMGDDD